MELKDSELEAILKNALNDNAEPSAELNAKLMKKLSARRKRHFLYDFKTGGAVAAAVVILISAGTFALNHDFNGMNNNVEIGMKTSGKKIDASTKDAGKYEMKSDEYRDSNSDETASHTSQSKAEAAASEKIRSSIQKKASDVTVSSDSVIQNDSNQKHKETAFSKTETVGGAIKESDDEVSEKMMSSAEKVSDKKEYKYLEIAAEGIGMARSALNETVNSYLGELYKEHYTSKNIVSMANEIVLARGMEDNICSAPKATQEYSGASGGGNGTESKKSEAEDKSSVMTDESVEEQSFHNDYQVLTDSEDYYCVKVNTEFSDLPEVTYSNTYTVDKNAEAIVTLDDIYSENANYKVELYENICTQMKERMKNDEKLEYFIGEYGFSEITGNEDFYVNDVNDVIITFEEGSVAPYGQGESAFNVGSPKK